MVVSVLLFTAVVVAAVRSYYVCETLVYNSPPNGGGRASVHVVDAVFGAVTYGRTSGVAGPTAPQSGFERRRVSARKVHDPRGGLMRWVGFDFRRADGWTTVSFPLWSLASLCLIVPARWVLQRRRDHRRRRDARCVDCGYDLRGGPDRCPECGAVSQPPAAA